MARIQPVILCGGSGTRLWPLSRSGFPKQFLCLTGDDSLFQQAAKRLSVFGGKCDEVSAPIIICHEDHRFLAQEQLSEIDALRDWGHAKDYVRMQWMMLQQEQPEDFVKATGMQYSVRQFIEKTADLLGMQISWEGSGVSELGY